GSWSDWVSLGAARRRAPSRSRRRPASPITRGSGWSGWPKPPCSVGFVTVGGMSGGPGGLCRPVDIAPPVPFGGHTAGSGVFAFVGPWGEIGDGQVRRLVRPSAAPNPTRPPRGRRPPRPGPRGGGGLLGGRPTLGEKQDKEDRPGGLRGERRPTFPTVAGGVAVPRTRGAVGGVPTPPPPPPVDPQSHRAPRSTLPV